MAHVFGCVGAVAVGDLQAAEVRAAGNLAIFKNDRSLQCEVPEVPPGLRFKGPAAMSHVVRSWGAT